MTPFQTRIDPSSDAFAAQRQGMLELIADWHALEQRASDASAKSAERFAKRGALLPRERLAQLLDPGAPFLPLATLAGYGMDDPDLARCVPGGSQLAGIGQVSGVRCMVVVTDSGIDAGALTEAGNQKLMRCQEIALQNKLPFVHLVESAGSNLRKYRVEKFIRGGGMFYNLARLSAAGLPPPHWWKRPTRPCTPPRRPAATGCKPVHEFVPPRTAGCASLAKSRVSAVDGQVQKSVRERWNKHVALQLAYRTPPKLPPRAGFQALPRGRAACAAMMAGSSAGASHSVQHLQVIAAFVEYPWRPQMNRARASILAPGGLSVVEFGASARAEEAQLHMRLLRFRGRVDRPQF
eukprot:gene28405-35253_t